MGLFDRKPKMFDFQGKFEYMEYTGKANLPDDPESLAKMELAYFVRNCEFPTKNDRKNGRIATAEYYEIALKLFSSDRHIPIEWEWQRKFEFATRLYNEDRGYVDVIKKFYSQFEPQERKRLAVKMITEAILRCVQAEGIPPGYKLDMVLYYLKCFGNYEYIMSLLQATAEKEMARGKKAAEADRTSLYTQAVIDFLEYDWPYFYENEFGILPDDRPRTVSGILKKYNLTVEEYYAKADSQRKPGRFVMPAVRVNPAQVIRYHLKSLGDDPFPKDYIGGHFADSYYNRLAGVIKKEIIAGSREQALFDGLRGHSYRGVVMAGEALVNWSGLKSFDYADKEKWCAGAYALLMRKNGYPESHYKNQIPKITPMYTETLSQEQRLRNLERATAVSKIEMFEPEL